MYLFQDKSAVGVGDGQGNLECRSPPGRKELDMTERLYLLTVITWENTYDTLRVRAGNKIVYTVQVHINKSVHTKHCRMEIKC